MCTLVSTDVQAQHPCSVPPAMKSQLFSVSCSLYLCLAELLCQLDLWNFPSKLTCLWLDSCQFVPSAALYKEQTIACCCLSLSLAFHEGGLPSQHLMLTCIIATDPALQHFEHFEEQDAHALSERVSFLLPLVTCSGWKHLGWWITSCWEAGDPEPHL